MWFVVIVGGGDGFLDGYSLRATRWRFMMVGEREGRVKQQVEQKNL